MKYSLLLLMASLAVGAAQADETNPPVAAPTFPAKSPIDVTAYVARGVDFFRAQAATNEDGWLVPPIEGSFSRVIGYTTNPVHFSVIEVTIPGYRYEDPYEVLVPGASPTDPMVRQTRYRTVILDPSKNYKQKTEVQDPKGSIIHDLTYPIYEKDIGARWPYGGLGNNALAILALRRCGVRGDDPLVTGPANHIARLINMFGYPDDTQDLAWMTAGFAVMPGDAFKILTEQCASKLLDAQITSGPATGMWGPVAINPAMVSAYLKVISKLADQKKALEAELAAEVARKSRGKPSARAARIEDELSDLDARMTGLQENTTRITQFGLLMFSMFGNQQWGWDNWNRRTIEYQAERINVESLPYLIQNQESADLDSTALAILALRVAVENGRLPAKTWRPEGPPAPPPAPGALPAPPPSDFPPPRQTLEVLELAAKAIAAAKPANGQWTEMNIDQRVADFAWLKSIPQVVSNDFPTLPEPVTMASVTRGAAVLANIQMILYARPSPTALETGTCRSFVDDLANDKVVLTNQDVRLPFDAMLQMTALRMKNGKTTRTDFSGWNVLADWLIHRQNPDGSWGTPKTKIWMPPTSLVALEQVLKNITDADLPKMYNKPHLAPPYFNKDNAFRFGANEVNYFTAASLLFLADGLPDGWVPPSAVNPVDSSVSP